MKNAESPTREIKDHDKHYFSNIPPEAWKEYGFSDRDLYPYRAPDFNEIMWKIRLKYILWDITKNGILRIIWLPG